MPAVTEAAAADLQAWRAAVRAALERIAPLGLLRAALEAEADAAVPPPSFENEVGLTGLYLAEPHGGAGGTIHDLRVAFEEMGRLLYAGPCLVTTLALELLSRSNADEVVKQVLRGTRVGIALEADHAMVAASGPSGYRVQGCATGGSDCGAADVILVRASLNGEEAVLAIRVGEAVHTVAQPTMDPGRPAWSLEITDSPAELVAQGGEAMEAMDAVALLATFLIATEALGAARACLDVAVEYAKERVQFGRPIGQFQAIKHQCAEMLVHTESARLAVEAAATELAADPTSEQTTVAVSLAKVCACESLYQCAVSSMHIFGGRGFLWEDNAHLYLRRAVVTSLRFGSTAQHRAVIADYLEAAARDGLAVSG